MPKEEKSVVSGNRFKNDTAGKLKRQAALSRYVIIRIIVNGQGGK